MMPSSEYQMRHGRFVLHVGKQQVNGTLLRSPDYATNPQQGFTIKFPTPLNENSNVSVLLYKDKDIPLDRTVVILKSPPMVTKGTTSVMLKIKFNLEKKKKDTKSMEYYLTIDIGDQKFITNSFSMHSHQRQIDDSLIKRTPNRRTVLDSSSSSTNLSSIISAATNTPPVNSNNVPNSHNYNNHNTNSNSILSHSGPLQSLSHSLSAPTARPYSNFGLAPNQQHNSAPSFQGPSSRNNSPPQVSFLNHIPITDSAQKRLFYGLARHSQFLEDEQTSVKNSLQQLDSQEDYLKKREQELQLERQEIMTEYQQVQERKEKAKIRRQELLIIQEETDKLTQNALDHLEHLRGYKIPTEQELGDIELSVSRHPTLHQSRNFLSTSLTSSITSNLASLASSPSFASSLSRSLPISSLTENFANIRPKKAKIEAEDSSDASSPTPVPHSKPEFPFASALHKKSNFLSIPANSYRNVHDLAPFSYQE